jgi:hypothetical protein
MAAGLGFIEFQVGDILTAASANGYLASQTVMVFASSAARASAITSPQEGMFSFLKDTDSLEFYNGTAWTASVTGDITGVTAGTGISGGGTSGTVTVTNSMATTITTAGDLIKGTGSGTFDRLGIGSTGQVLTVAGGAPSWATPSAGGGGKVLQVVYGMYNTQTLINNAGYTDTGLSATITPTLNTSKVLVMTSNFAYWAESSGNPGMGLQILKGSTAVYEQHPSQNSLAIIVGASGSRGLLGNVVLQYLDSPATTSATTYKTQAKTNCAAYLQWDGGKSNIILMEIGA